MYSYKQNASKELVLELIDFCKNNNIQAVAGPILSGATIATATAMAAVFQDVSLRAIFLNKINGLYSCYKHTSGTRELFGEDDHHSCSVDRVMLVDDVIDSGTTIIHAVGEFRDSYYDAEIAAIFIMGGWNKINTKRLQLNLCAGTVLLHLDGFSRKLTEVKTLYA